MAKKKKQTVAGSLKLAAKHLAKVDAARTAPDWDDLSIYGLYCLEALVRAAVIKSTGKHETKTHWGKADQAKELSKLHGLPEIDKLLQLLNDARKSEAYDDEDFDESDHDANQIADRIQAYFDAVTKFASK
jgi:hypothetical protein